MLRVGTDCSGLDAPLIALKELNIDYEYIFCSEINQKLIQIIQDKNKPQIVYDNIIKRNHKLLPQIDLYIAGFPCPSFSTASRYREGFDSDRGSLFFHCYETIKYAKPKYFILENVKGIKTHNKGETFKLIQNYLNKLTDYNIHYELINSKYFTPQDRTRLYIIGISKQITDNILNFNTYNKQEKHITDIIDINNKTENILSFKKTKLLNEIITKKNIKEDDWWIINLNTSCVNFATAKKNLSPTLLTSCQMYYINKSKRYLTLSELQKLQGVESLNLSHYLGKIEQITAIGNSMTVPVIKYLLSILLI